MSRFGWLTLRQAYASAGLSDHLGRSGQGSTHESSAIQRRSSYRTTARMPRTKAPARISSLNRCRPGIHRADVPVATRNAPEARTSSIRATSADRLRKGAVGTITVARLFIPLEIEKDVQWGSRTRSIHPRHCVRSAEKQPPDHGPNAEDESPDAHLLLEQVQVGHPYGRCSCSCVERARGAHLTRPRYKRGRARTTTWRRPPSR